jgi:hypothetical protein
MIIRISRRGFEECVVLNKKQMAVRCAPRKYEIKEAIAELRSTGQLPSKYGDYKPNYECIKTIYAINAARLLKLENEKKKKNEADRDVNADAASNVNNANIMPPVDLVSNLYIDMLKEIIMCDYNHVDYIPKTDDDLLSLATLVKSRKKVTGLLTKGIEQQDADPVILLDISRLYDPDDDKEEREERRKLALERLEVLEETLRQWKDLSNLPGDKEVERYIEVKLGLAIASITAHRQFPEVGFTYKQLAFELFLKPEPKVTRNWSRTYKGL